MAAAKPTPAQVAAYMEAEKMDKAREAMISSRMWGRNYLYALVLPMTLRTIWYTLVASYVGLTMNTPALFISAIHLVACVAFHLAKPGQPGENFILVKVASTIAVFVLTLIGANSYKYHVMTGEQLHISNRLSQRIEFDYKDLPQNEFMMSMTLGLLSKLDIYLDGSVFLLACLVVSNLHTYVTLQMQLDTIAKDQDETLGAAKKVDKPAENETPTDSSADNAEPKGVTKRRANRLA